MARLNFLVPNSKGDGVEHIPTREELYQKIKRKSLNTLKWIIVVNVLILAFFTLSSFLFNINSQPQSNSLPASALIFADYSLLILPIVFTIVCVYMIFKITRNNTVETLLLNIKNAKNVLKLYLSLILIAYLIIIYITIYQTIVSGTNDVTLNESWTYYTAIILTCVVCTIIILLILWILYKLLYSRFLKKLTKNYYILKDML